MAARKPKPTSIEDLTSKVKRHNVGNGHWYHILQPDGSWRKADGVTTLLGNGMRKEALENWAANETAGYAVDHWDELAEMPMSKRHEVLKKARYQVRDEAARRGTEIHRLAEMLLKGEEVQVPDELAAHVNSAVLFMNEWQVEEIITETSVYHVRGNYAGTLDMAFRSALFPGKVFLGDWKTSRSGIYGETALQLEAYSRADAYVDADGFDQSVSDLGITDHVAIWVRSDGYDVFPMSRGDDVFRTFQYVAEVARRTGGKDRPLDALKGAPLYLPGVAA